MKVYLEQLLQVPARDPDDARRKRLLNILLLGTLVAALLGLLAIVVDAIQNPKTAFTPETQILLGGIIAVTLGIFAIYQVNRRFSGRLAPLLFLLLLTLLFPFTDSVDQVINGRSLFLFTLPITISSLILIPQASFLFAALSSAIMIGMSLANSVLPNSSAITGFFLLALVSWLSARSLEQALHELRDVNANLDQLVTERTQALAESLERERIEAGRNQAILNSIADGVVVFDREWNAILANPAMKNMLDLPIELIVNKNFRNLIEHPRLSIKSRSLLYAMMGHDTQPPSFRI